jgi:hypothetical protein
MWPGVLGAGVTLLVGAAAAWIAYNQFLIAQANLRLALFERRFAVLEHVREFLYLATSAADTDVSSMSVLQKALIDAPFLFGDEVVIRLDEIREKALELRLYNISLHGPQPADDPNLAQKKAQVLNWLATEYEEFPNLLQPYMGFNEWRLKTPTGLAAVGGARHFVKRRS